jgi:hypothetical protein
MFLGTIWLAILGIAGVLPLVIAATGVLVVSCLLGLATHVLEGVETCPAGGAGRS